MRKKEEAPSEPRSSAVKKFYETTYSPPAAPRLVIRRGRIGH